MTHVLYVIFFWEFIGCVALFLSTTYFPTFLPCHIAHLIDIKLPQASAALFFWKIDSSNLQFATKDLPRIFFSFFLSGKKGLDMKFHTLKRLKKLEHEFFRAFQSVGQVHAEDADKGINGEIYFSLKDPNSPLAVDPVTGVISLTRPLSYAKNPRHTINVVAQDRGAKSRFAMRAPDTAKVQLSVRQVISVSKSD